MSSKECGRGVFVRRMAWVLGVCLAVAVFLTGCELIRIEEGERTPVEYAIVKQEELPDEAVEFIEQRKKKEFQMTYLVGDVLYLLKGYGEQMTGGYSIQVEEVSESENVFGDDGFKRFDLGLGLKAGIEISKKYQFSIGYDFGFIEAEELMGCKNRNLMISLGLMF